MRALPAIRGAVIAVALCTLPLTAFGQDTPTVDHSQDTMQKQDNQQTFVGKIVKDGDRCSISNELIDQVRTNEAGTTCDQNTLRH